MKHNIVYTLALGLAVLSSGSVAEAAIISFAGSMTGLGVAGPDASCAPLPYRGTISPDTTVGLSSLGSHSICLAGLPGPSGGDFALDFGYGALSGTMIGGATFSDTPGIANVAWTYTILGGSGKFAGATGWFLGTGTSDARVFPSQIALTFDGSVNAAGVPEPATWALLILGFGMIGTAARRRHLSSGLSTITQV